MARELARHCTVANREGDKLQLHLDSTALGLLNDRSKNRIQQALNEHLGETLRIEIDLPQAGATAAAAATDDTPAQQAESAQQERQTAAEQAIKNDMNVQRMQELFGAQVQPDSVAPANP